MTIYTATYMRQQRGGGGSTTVYIPPPTDVQTEAQPISISNMPADADTLGEVIEELANPLKTEEW